MSDMELDPDSSRLYAPCDVLTSQFGPTQLVRTCNEDCGGRFFARCCRHPRILCHHAQVVYTDGACMNNGKFGATAGIGIAFGTCASDQEDEDSFQFSIPVDDRLDPGAKRTSQRAELLAALEGLKKICDCDAEWMADNRPRRHRDSSNLPLIIITTDSEYVVKGMTEWLPNWKKNGLRKANGQRPSNLDLFRELDAEIEERERRHRCQVRFWHINREYNTIADQLAKRAARIAPSA